MDAATLERLLLDRTLGALSPDVEELLAAHLDGNTDAQRLASEFDQATAVARQLLGGNLSTSLPHFPAIHIHKVEQARRQLARVRYAASVAATLVIGVGLGAAMFGGAATKQHPIETTPRPVVANIESGHHRMGTEDFWSAKRLAQAARHSARAESSGLVWNSAVRRPQLGGES